MEELSGEALVLLAALSAIQLSQGKAAEELSELAAFFTVLGDNLALLALSSPSRECLSAANGSSTPEAPLFVP